MKYVDEFRQASIARGLAGAIAAEADPSRTYRLMEFCGGHTHAIFRYGVQELVPDNVHYVHGPGCPVCVLPAGRIDAAAEIARQADVILCIYADLLRVPGGRRESLMTVRASGADVRMVYSTQDALALAREHPHRQVVFFAIGFETTAPATAVALRQAAAESLTNFSVFCNHVLTPAAMRGLLSGPSGDGVHARIDGFLGPSHVSAVIGTRPYEFVARDHRRPVVVTGFEPLDVMQATLMLVRQLNAGRHAIENQYQRVVTRDGNRKAQRIVSDVFETRSEFEWRGLGVMPESALQIRTRYAAFDAERRFDVANVSARDTRGCECPAVLCGALGPPDCRLFGIVCTPDNPMGACMVSSEGACAAYYAYGRFRDSASRAETAA